MLHGVRKIISIYTGTMLRTPCKIAPIYRKSHCKIAYPYAKWFSSIDRRNFACPRKTIPICIGTMLRTPRNIIPIHIGMILCRSTQN